MISGTLDHLAFRVSDPSDMAYDLEQFGYMAGGLLHPLPNTASEPFTHPDPNTVDVFVSWSTARNRTDGVVGEWVRVNGSGLHHMAYAVTDIYKAVQVPNLICWNEVVECPCEKPLRQVFSYPSFNGLVFELIERNGHPGFCEHNVAKLMEQSVND